jgi:hypothetical protein
MDALKISPLTRDVILRATDIKHIRIDVPEWGGSILVKGMNALQRDTMMKFIDPKQEPVPDSQLKAYLCAHCIVDDAGNSLFTDSDIEHLQKKNPMVLDRIANEILRLSGIGADAVEVIAKN